MGTDFISATFEKLYAGVLGIDVFLWLLGTLVQIARNRKVPPQEDHEGYIIGKLPWTYLFGVRPKTEKVFITPALLSQVPALVHLLVGGMALWLDKSDAYEVITTACWILFPWLGVIYSTVSHIRKESTKATDGKMEAAGDKNATSEPETTDDNGPAGEQEEGEANLGELTEGSRERIGRRRRD